MPWPDAEHEADKDEPKHKTKQDLRSMFNVGIGGNTLQLETKAKI